MKQFNITGIIIAKQQNKMHEQHVKEFPPPFWAPEVTRRSCDAAPLSKALPCRYVVIGNQIMPELTILNVKTDVDQ
jgi:hypothetical protein